MATRQEQMNALARELLTKLGNNFIPVYWGVYNSYLFVHASGHKACVYTPFTTDPDMVETIDLEHDWKEKIWPRLCPYRFEMFNRFLCKFFTTPRNEIGGISDFFHGEAQTIALRWFDIWDRVEFTEVK